MCLLHLLVRSAPDCICLPQCKENRVEVREKKTGSMCLFMCSSIFVGAVTEGKVKLKIEEPVVWNLEGFHFCI
ncbi:hypothetical protein EJB05_02910 [Eragrostis curvula]|uniref:Uncharacterized protein n=1 Tax=Eragrostis curvula TaxID=38414 RepID=A0A5J9WTN7_9POAL|nr:hypothetical protein EJB05_02910 [Eragrostis curvula]